MSKNHNVEIRMSKVPKSCMTRAHTSDINLAKIMRDPERVKRSSANTSFLTRFYRQKRKLHKQIVTVDNILWPDGEDPSSFPEHGVKPAPESLSEYLNHSQLCAQIRKITQQGANCTGTFEINKSFLKTAVDALSDAF